jgi:hypothetical protein
LTKVIEIAECAFPLFVVVIIDSQR